MRRIILKIIIWKLKIISQLFLFRYKPKIIGVTGTVGKSSTKEAIYTVLKSKFSVRRSLGSYNNEIGAPLTILGSESAGANIWGWIIIFLRALKKLIYDSNYPKVLVLELGVDKPNDLEYLLSFIKPKIAVITSIGPAHLEKMGSEEEIYQEKAKLAKHLPKNGTAILNYDDQRLRRLGLEIGGKVIFFGLDSQANMSADQIKYIRHAMTFGLNWAGSVVPTFVSSLGLGQIYAALAASAAATVLGMDLVSITQELKKIRGLKGRLKLLAGKHNTYLLDDTYNSNPISASLSLKTAREIKKDLGAKRLVAVLGEMLELGDVSRRSHLNLGREAGKMADLVLAVGKEAKNIISGARQSKATEARWFSSSKVLAKKILTIIKPYDLILIKGSQGVRMEKVSAVLLKNKRDIKHLPRMSGLWLNK